MERFIPYIIVLALISFVCVFLKRILSDKEMRQLKIRNLYGDFVYDPSQQAFTAKIYWCDHYVVAYWCCADPQSSSCRAIQVHFRNLMVYSPGWDQTLKRRITDFFFTADSEFVEFEATYPFGKNIYLRSKAAFQDSLTLVQLVVYSSGALSFNFRNKDIPELNSIIVDTSIDGTIYTVGVIDAPQNDFHVVWNTTKPKENKQC